MSEMEMFDGEVHKDKKDKKGSVKKGIAIGLIITVVFELIIGLALDAETNLVHRYLAYMLGIIPIIVGAIYTRNMFKMIFVGSPILIAGSFALPYFLPNIFSGLMTPFLNLLPIVNRASAIITEFGIDEGGEISGILATVNQFGVVLDFVLAMFVATFVGVGISPFARIIFGKPNILTFISAIFGAGFLFLGLVVLPYTLVVVSGTAQFAMSTGVGAALLGTGIQESTDPNGNLTQANVLFGEAEIWFADSENMLNGLKALGVFRLLTSANQQYAAIVDNGLLLMEAAIDLAQGISPALAGIAAMSRGMEQAIGALGASSSAMLQLSQNDDEFDEGITLIEQGFENFTEAVVEIKEALTTVAQMDVDELNAALIEQGAGNQTESLALLLDGIAMLNATLDIFTNPAGTGLINDPDGEDRAPLIHLLFAAKAMSEVQEQIGETTNFVGTGPKFQEVIDNLEKTLPALDDSKNKAIDDLDRLSVTSNDISEMKSAVVGTIAFLRDVGNITLSIGEFGVIASPTLVTMNSTMKFLTDSTDFTAITESTYDTQIDAFDNSQGIISNASLMQGVAFDVESQIDLMEFNSVNDEYGFLGEPAQTFVTEFRAFNLTRNANNFFYISSGFSALLKSAKALSNVDVLVDNISNSTTAIKNEIDTNGIGSNTTLIQSEADSIETNIASANTALQVAKDNILNASVNFNKTESMPQLKSTSDAFLNVASRIDRIQFGDGPSGTNDGMVGIDREIRFIKANATAPLDVNTLSNVQSSIGQIISELDFITLEFDGIQSDLTGVSIAA